MHIPRTIHYCWFGYNPKPVMAQRCIRSWKKYCPDYQIIEWNEDNFDISSCPLYVRQAYDAKKWAFVTDYVRLKVVYDHGGIYLDTDVELLKKPDSLLGYNAYFGFENEKNVATGLGFGAVPGASILHDMMRDYENIPFVLDNGEYDLTPCPIRNTPSLVKRGLVQNNTTQELMGKILVLDTRYLSPKNYTKETIRRTAETISIHWFTASWKTKSEKRAHIKRVIILWSTSILDYLRHLPNRILRLILGSARYEELKRKLKRTP